MGCVNRHHTVPVNHKFFLLFLDTIFVFFFCNSCHFFGFIVLFRIFFFYFFSSCVFSALTQHRLVLVNILHILYIHVQNPWVLKTQVLDTGLLNCNICISLARIICQILRINYCFHPFYQQKMNERNKRKELLSFPQLVVLSHVASTAKDNRNNWTQWQ